MFDGSVIPRSGRQGAPTPPASPALHEAMMRARCSLGLALLMRCIMHKRRLSAAGNAGLAEEIVNSEGAALDRIEMSSANLRMALQALEEGSPRLAERMVLSAAAHADVAVAALAIEWNDRLDIPVPQGAHAPVDHLRELAQVAAEIGRNGDAAAELVTPRVRIRRPRAGPRRRPVDDGGGED